MLFSFLYANNAFADVEIKTRPVLVVVDIVSFRSKFVLELDLV